MTFIVNPTNYLRGRCCLPASKSYSIRAFIIAACGGRSEIFAPSDCDDAKVALSVAMQLGAKVKRVRKDHWEITAKAKKSNLTRINVGESGTALRFILPLLPLFTEEAEVLGEGTLQGRPNHHLTKVLRQQGVDIRGRGDKESVPISLSGGTLRGGTITIDGSLSSQFISALLIACPQVLSDTRIAIKGRKLVSQDYIQMTQSILKKSGVVVKKVNPRLYKVSGGQKFKGLKKFTVPSDYGLAAFLLAAGALVDSDLVFQGSLKDDLVQADARILGLLKKMGVRFTRTTKSLKIKGPFQLRGGEFSLKDCPDLVPIISVLALFAKGKTRLYDIKHARVKESDRISDLRKELLKVGAKISEKSNELTIYPREQYRSNILLDPHSDHRLAMSFCVLGLKIGTRVKDIGCVAKSYPGFVKDFKKIGAKIDK
ncbi:MAG: 3-phosphoshikimate 1-carboxyvinyltransferase [Candidatus Omnitrophica bacterium]|nr:3-phosphoshikimate 1-carboxyvinyltransferase [Candidatus Omnitrophota bacterium]